MMLRMVENTASACGRPCLLLMLRSSAPTSSRSISKIGVRPTRVDVPLQPTLDLRPCMVVLRDVILDPPLASLNVLASCSNCRIGIERVGFLLSLSRVSWGTFLGAYHGRLVDKEHAPRPKLGRATSAVVKHTAGARGPFSVPFRTSSSLIEAGAFDPRGGKTRLRTFISIARSGAAFCNGTSNATRGHPLQQCTACTCDIITSSMFKSNASSFD